MVSTEPAPLARCRLAQPRPHRPRALPRRRTRQVLGAPAACAALVAAAAPRRRAPPAASHLPAFSATLPSGSFQLRQSLYFQVEFADGGDLFSCLDPNTDGLSTHLSKKYLTGLAEGLAHLHKQGIVHCDIKPENCLITKGELKICDFGLAGYSDETRVGRATGTGAYMGPELVNRSSSTPYKIRANQDTWSFGVLLYAILFQDLPWEKAKMRDGEFAKYCARGVNLLYPFNLLTGGMRMLMSQIMSIHPQDRPSMVEVVQCLRDMGDWFPGGQRVRVTSYGIRDLSPGEMLAMGAMVGRSKAAEKSASNHSDNSDDSADSVLSLDDAPPCQGVDGACLRAKGREAAQPQQQKQPEPAFSISDLLFSLNIESSQFANIRS